MLSWSIGNPGTTLQGIVDRIDRGTSSSVVLKSKTRIASPLWGHGMLPNGKVIPSLVKLVNGERNV